MKKRELTRRDFLKGTLGAGIAISSLPLISGCAEFNPHGLPTAVLGKTGVSIPRIAIGLGSRFCSIDNETEALELLNYSLDNGLYYWDTAYNYENKKNGAVSEERIGKIAKNRRDEIFLSTKVSSRDPDEAMKQIETSLKRLQTDHLDMLKIHSIINMDDVARVSEKGNLIEIVSRLKEQKVTRFIGFSGHTNADAMKAMAERGDFDSMLIAMNHHSIVNNPQSRQELAVPAAREKGMGVMLMKVIRPKESNEKLRASELVRFALSLDGPSGLTIGMESLDIVNSNLNILRNFTPMSEEEKNEYAALLYPELNRNKPEWLKPGYTDGYWG